MLYTITAGHRSAGLRHNPINALVAPRPIGWVSTVDREGRSNLAPFSYFNLVSSDPPVVMFSPNEKDPHGTPKDTLRNVRETGEFVANIVPWRLRHAMNVTSTVLAYGESEFKLANLTEVASALVRPPRVGESPAALECRLLQIVDLPVNSDGRRYHVVLGQVVAVHIDDAVITDGIVDTLKIAPLARMGGSDYTHVERCERIPRPPGGGS